MKNYENETDKEMSERELGNKFNEIELIFSENIHLFNQNNRFRLQQVPVNENHFSEISSGQLGSVDGFKFNKVAENPNILNVSKDNA